MFYYLYEIRNNLNDKIYVGVHKTKDINDGYMGSGTVINAAIKKHGIVNFSKVILEVFDTPEAMYAREKEVVNDNFLMREDVYNLRRGGIGGFGNHISKKGVAARQKKLTERIALYDENPVRCKNCDLALTYNQRRGKYCSKGCAASFNNSIRVRTEESKQKCSVTLSGVSKTPEHIAAITKAMRERYGSVDR